MIQRCTNQKHQAYANYGGRGITVCERWRVFENFLADMGEHPEGLSIDRIDNDGNYEPGNCRWASALQQRHNPTRQPQQDRNREMTDDLPRIPYCELKWYEAFEKLIALDVGAKLTANGETFKIVHWNPEHTHAFLQLRDKSGKSRMVRRGDVLMLELKVAPR
jgi:hypothetical protein